MPFIVTNDSRKELFREDKLLTAQELQSSTIVEEEKQMKYAFGEARYRELYFDGLHIGYGRAKVYENLHIAAEMPESPTLVSLHFVLQGHFIAHLPGRSGCHYYALEHNLVYNPELLEAAEIKKQDGIEMVGLSLTKERFLELAENNGDVLNRLGERVAGNKLVFLNRYGNQPITHSMLRVLDEIRHCQFQGGIKKLFLQSKVLELLALQCEQYERSAPGGRLQAVTPLSATDRDKIYHARELLLGAVQQPPSLRELSRQAGLNEFKLKTGFKKVFDNTVFGYLNDYRLEQARELLLQQQHTPISAIAEELGYSSPQHFCNAFRKKFGVSPGKSRRTDG
ncbi:helix-turn-helix transcriptional regulator [Chitinophaga japonensis]|uniref:AraC-like DNA-binding protein n=1 Tax=Chitinophaga japonensis TaxID=104662 RepID=A0A562SSR5_CHIJA|nr:AraC family transcriptional regulator [Chitinophaga japonensis]TWI84291.1 AraC-like DNA-binding protein [Chitinophaga japonensis]